MGIIKDRRIKKARKEAAIAARNREVRIRRDQGYTLKEIAEELNLKESTVRNIIKKHGV